MIETDPLLDKGVRAARDGGRRERPGMNRGCMDNARFYIITGSEYAFKFNHPEEQRRKAKKRRQTIGITPRYSVPIGASTRPLLEKLGKANTKLKEVKKRYCQDLLFHKRKATHVRNMERIIIKSVCQNKKPR